METIAVKDLNVNFKPIIGVKYATWNFAENNFNVILINFLDISTSFDIVQSQLHLKGKSSHSNLNLSFQKL